jgi:hypothetical protein
MASINSAANRTGARLRLCSASQVKPTNIDKYSNTQCRGNAPGGSSTGESLAVVEGAVVPTFSVTDCAVVPLICSDELDKLQVGPRVIAGVLAQLRLTVPLNVPDPAKLRLKLAVCPALTVCDVDEPEPGFRLKSGAAWTMRDTVELFAIDPEPP